MTLLEKGSTTIIRISGNQSVMHKEGFKRKSKRKWEKVKEKKKKRRKEDKKMTLLEKGDIVIIDIDRYWFENQSFR